MVSKIWICLLTPIKVPRWLRVLIFTSIVLLGNGIIFNRLVDVANNGKMPVATQKEDILFVVGHPKLGVTYFLTMNDLKEDPRHEPLIRNMKFRILADRIPMSFSFIPEQGLPSWCYTALEMERIPVNDDGIASIGDLLMWTGTLLALLNIPILSCWIVRIFLNLYGKT